MYIRFILFIAFLVYSTFLTASENYQVAKLDVEDFMEKPFVFDAEFSPDGRYLAMIIKSKESRAVVIRDFSAERFPVTGVLSQEILRASSLSWANNNRLIVNFLVPNMNIKKLKRKSESDPEFNIDDYAMHLRAVSMNTRAEDHVLLLNHSNNFEKYNLSRIANYLPNDDEHILMHARGSRRLALKKVNVYSGRVTSLADGGPRTYKFLTDNNGKPTYRLDYYDRSKYIVVFEYTELKDWKIIDRIRLDQEDDESINNEGLLRYGIGNNDSFIYRERNQETGFYEIVQRNRGNDKREVIASLPDKDIYQPIFSRHTNKYIGYQIQDDLIRDIYFNETSQAHYDSIAKAVGHSNFSVWTSRKPGDRTIVNTSGADNPGRFYIYNFKDKKVSLLNDKYQKLIPDNLSLPGKVFYKTRDGAKVRAYILFPPEYQEGKRTPMVILPHGGPHTRDSATFDHFAQFISTRGYIVIQPNFRGSSGYGQSFEEAGYKQWGELMQDDLTDAVNYMVKKGYADPAKICIVGASYGGYAALMGAAKTPDLYQCSVSINGVTHLKNQIEFDIDSANANEEKIEKRIYKTIGHPKEDSEMLDNNSPALQAKAIRIPILIIAGEDDNIVPIEQSEMMVEALEDHNKRHKFIELNNTGHNFFRHQEGLRTVYSEVEEFLKEHIGYDDAESKSRN